MGFGHTRKRVIESLQFYLCNGIDKRKTIEYNDIYYYFQKNYNQKVGKSRVREIIIELEEKGIINTTEVKKINRGRPHKQICLNPQSKNLLEALSH